MPRLLRLKDHWKTDRGAVIVTVAAMMVVLLALGSLAVDIGYIMVIRNQLQNAADAGALRGARVLYTNNGQTINTGANSEAYLAAIDNLSQNQPVEVTDYASNSGDVQRGHWSFASRTFTANGSTTPVDLWDRTTAELDADPNYINAVKVIVHRENIPANSFLSKIIGYDNFTLEAEAVAYIGFAGTLAPGEVDQPIAICKQSITDFDSGAYTCNTGRMINSSGGTTTNTGGWTNFSQPCETASASSVRPLVCGDGNPVPVTFGEGLGTVGGMQDNVYRDLRDCWLNDPTLAKDADGRPIVPWNMSLPVIDCQSNNVSPCSQVVGAVNLNVIWVKQSGADPQFRDVPLRMNAAGQSWVCSSVTNYIAGHPGETVETVQVNDLSSGERQVCWSEFGSTFFLETADGTSVSTLSASDLQKTIFFLPDCTPHEPKGRTGGQNFGILAEIPVLVD